MTKAQKEVADKYWLEDCNYEMHLKHKALWERGVLEIKKDGFASTLYCYGYFINFLYRFQTKSEKRNIITTLYYTIDAMEGHYRNVLNDLSNSIRMKVEEVA